MKFSRRLVVPLLALSLAGCAMAAYPWHVDESIRPVNQTSTDVFDASKPSRRPKESSP